MRESGERGDTTLLSRIRHAYITVIVMRATFCHRYLQVPRGESSVYNPSHPHITGERGEGLPFDKLSLSDRGMSRSCCIRFSGVTRL